MATQIQLRRGTSAEWAAANPVLAQGEVGIDLTLGEMRLGDGVTAWAGLTSIGAVDPADVDAAIAAYLLAHPAVDQITLTAPLALTVPAGFPAGQVYRVVFTQDTTGGHTVTYGGTIDGTQAPVRTEASAVTVVDLYPIGGGLWRAFSDLVEASAPVGAAVTPMEPTFTDPSGTTNDRYTIPSQAGVLYRVGGTVTTAGTYTPTAGQAITITAEAAASYTITAGATATWSHTFSTAVSNTAPSMTLGTETITGLAVSHPFSTSDADGDAVTVSASWGDGQSGIVSSPAQHTYAAAGTYTASFTPNDGVANGAVRTASYTVAVALPPVGTPATLAEAIVAYGAAGYWKLNETAGTTITDYSGNGRHGTVEGVAGTDYKLGLTNGFAEFLSPAGKVTIPDNNVWTIANSGMTVFSIHRLTQDVSQPRTLVAKAATDQVEWRLRRATWGFTADATNSIGSVAAYQTNSGDVLPTNLTAWKGMAVNFPLPGGSNGPLFYLGNGTPVGTPAFNSGVYANRTAPVTIGTDFRGAIGHVAIFPIMLTAAHITKLMDLARAEGLIT